MSRGLDGDVTRRELIEASAFLVALGALPGVAAAKGSAAAADPAAALVSGEAWDRFCDSLKSAGRYVLQDGAPDGGLDRAEGYRMLTRFISLAFEQLIERSDPDHPSFHRVNTDIRKYAGDNPDQDYPLAIIAGDRTYRITGNRGNALLVEIGVYAGNWSGKNQRRRMIADRSEEDLVFDADGNIEIILSPDPPADHSDAKNYIRLEPDASKISIREYFADPLDKHSEYRIERIPVAPPRAPLRPEEMAERLQAVNTFLEGNLRVWTQRSASRAAAGRHNQLIPLADTGNLQTPSGIRYLNGYWKLADDEALVLEFTPAEVPYWGFLIMNFWMESLEYRERPVSINNFQAKRDAQGVVRIVVAHENPGVPNWIDTAGHREGTMLLRWARGNDRVPKVAARVVNPRTLS
jgi:hypothetical protein